jgi:hypothetical protein
MTTEVLIRRINSRIDGLWPRDVLEREMGNWKQAWSNYWERLCKHVRSGGRINDLRYIIFKRIVSEAVESIQVTLDMIDIQEGKPVALRP